MKIPLSELERGLKTLKAGWPEVTGLSVGKREKQGKHQIDQEDVIIINVDKKVRFPRLSKRHALPKKMWGVPTDIQAHQDFPVNAINRAHLKTDYIVSGGYGGSMGLFIEHEEFGLVGVTNRHVANLRPDSDWYLIDNKSAPYCRPVIIAQKNVDAALMDITPNTELREVKLTAHQGVQFASPQIGMTAYYLGGRTNREENGKIKIGHILQMGWGAILDPKSPDGIYTTVNFKFLNLKGDTCSPIPGDSGTPVYTDIYGKPFCIGVVYSGGDRNEFCGAVPITNILDEFTQASFGEAPIFDIPGYVRLTEYEELMETKDNLYNHYRRYARAAVQGQKEINRKNDYIKQLEQSIKHLEEK